MLPLKYLADADNNPVMTSAAWIYDKVPGELKACDNCGIVKFYSNEE